MRKRILAGLAALAAVIGTVAVPTSAQADEWGPVVHPGVLFYTDNSTVTYCYTQGFNSFRAVADEGMRILDATTDLTSQLPGTPEFCEFDQTDAWWWSVDFPGSTRGRTTCHLVAPWDGTICQGHDIQMDFPQLDIGSNDPEDRLKTAVHELGHFLGLQHDTPDGAGSAMISGEIPNTNIQYRRWSSHHINQHLNVRY